MRSVFVLTTLLLLASCAATSGGSPTPDGTAGQHAAVSGGDGETQPFHTHAPAEIAWKPGPPSLAAGAQMTVLEGDPTKQGPFVFRVKVPDGFLIKPHTHPRAERVTVIQGTFNIAMEHTVAEAQMPGNYKSMPAGSFGYWPAGMVHVAWVTGDTIVQFHGDGPWVINYINRDDDPRNVENP